jgi:oxygen-independent coproporphyrinogen-3 oxidase
VAVEVDPVVTTRAQLKLLRSFGFNRISLGVQDLDPKVQHAIDRIQTEEETRGVLEYARSLGFQGINVDLIYGLPYQTQESWAKTLQQILAMKPDRAAVYGFAYVPDQRTNQKRLPVLGIPRGSAKLDLFRTAWEAFVQAGYSPIGMDHFARPDDELAVAQSQGRLQRNFQGYSTHAGSDMLGFGVSAIGRVGPAYYQNVKDLQGYYDAIDEGHLPVWRGIELTADDLVRRSVIQALICNFRLSIQSIELSWLIDFRKYFAEELQDLQRLAEDGLVELQPDWIVVTPKGRLLVRAVCMVFDRYLRVAQKRASYSRVI